MSLPGRDKIRGDSGREDKTQERILQYQTFPVGGVTVEF
jgi:hypothetical protein